jgi:hypothetical protein
MNFTQAIIICCIAGMLYAVETAAQQNQRRNRGETFYLCQNSNTAGPGDIWVALRAVGHIWDDSPIALDTTARSGGTGTTSPRKWISNIRAFPEVYLQGGITDFLSIHASCRALSYGFSPGWYNGGIKLTYPNNLDLRLHGFGLSVDYRYITRESAPSLGGYNGFMPEGFGIKGHNLETMFAYEFDLTPRLSIIPLRFLANTGVRVPLSKRHELFQFLVNAGIVYSGYGFDFFVQYNLESFNNIFGPITIEDGSKKFLVWLPENPMYVTLGGNVRYDNGVTLALAVPILLSANEGSRMRTEDLVELHHRSNPGLFSYEKEQGIVDPFDPWFVKWKIAGTLSFPLRFKMTGAEMMRNYLILKNRKQAKRIDIDIDSRLEPQGDEDAKKKDAEEKAREDDRRRLEAIKKKREAISK